MVLHSNKTAYDDWCTVQVLGNPVCSSDKFWRPSLVQGLPLIKQIDGHDVGPSRQFSDSSNTTAVRFQLHLLVGGTLINKRPLLMAVSVSGSELSLWGRLHQRHY